jgi:HEPN domain-containing protein
LSIDPVEEAKYRFKLASTHLARAERLLSIGDSASTIHFAQLAIENFAKAIIALYEIPTWSHDPSSQLLSLIDRLPQSLVELVRELALIAREAAPEHGRSTYGEPSKGLIPNEIYTEAHAKEFVTKARRARDIALRVFEELNIAIS